MDMPIERFSEDEPTEDGEVSPVSGTHSDRLYLHDSGQRMRRALAVTSSTRRPQDRREDSAGDLSEGERTRTDLTTDRDLEAFLGRARTCEVGTKLSSREMRAVLDTLAQTIAAGGATELGAQLQLPEGFFPVEG